MATHATYTFLSLPSQAGNWLQHRHQLSHSSNALTVERKNQKTPFLPCLPKCKAYGCCYNRQMGICWHKHFSEADRQQLCTSLLLSWVPSRSSGSVTRKQPSPKEQEWCAELQGGHRINCVNARGSVELEAERR